MRGLIKVVKLEDAVAVVADSWWRAKTALELMPVEWDFGEAARKTAANDIVAFGGRTFHDGGGPALCNLYGAAEPVLCA